MRWHFGQSGGNLSELRSVLTDSHEVVAGAETALRRFAQAPMSGQLAAGLTTDRRHQQQVIEQALTLAQTTWLASLDDNRNRIAGLVWKRCSPGRPEVRQNYQAMLELDRDFSRSASRESLEDLSRRWLALIPQPAGASSTDAKPNTKLLQPLRNHLANVPLDAHTKNHQILKQPARRPSRRPSTRSARTCRQSLPKETAAENQAFITQLQDQLASMEKEMREAIEQKRSQYRLKIESLDELLEAYTQHKQRTHISIEAEDIERLQLLGPAEEVEQVLNNLARDLQANLTVRFEPNIEAWEMQLKSLMQKQEPPRIESRWEDWQPHQLEKLVQSMTQARKRYEGRIFVRSTARPPRPHARRRTRSFHRRQRRRQPRPKTLRFDGLKNRHAASFLSAAVESRQAFEQLLQQAADADVISDLSYLRERLDESVRQYVAHYLLAWSDAYSRYQLETVRAFELDPPKSWNDYRRWLRDYESTLTIEYENHIDALFNNAIAPFQSGGGIASDSVAVRAETARHVGPGALAGGQ